MLMTQCPVGVEIKVPAYSSNPNGTFFFNGYLIHSNLRLRSGKGESLVTKGLPGRCKRSLSSILENVIHSDEETSNYHPSTRVSWLPTKGSPTEGEIYHSSCRFSSILRLFHPIFTRSPSSSCVHSSGAPPLAHAEAVIQDSIARAAIAFHNPSSHTSLSLPRFLEFFLVPFPERTGVLTSRHFCTPLT